jgi:hypothetical protein
MNTYQKIGIVKVFVNSNVVNRCDFNSKQRSMLGEDFKTKYENFIKDYEEKEEIYIECGISQTGDLIFDLGFFVLYQGLHTNVSNYHKIQYCIYDIIDHFKEISLSIDEDKNFKLAVKESHIAPYPIALKRFEKAEAEIIKKENDGKYVLFKSESQLNDHFSKRLKDNFYFINCYRTTDIPEVDTKLLEARYCIAFGMTQSAISMLFITSEEALKSLLKYNLMDQKLKVSKQKPNLTELSDISNEAEKEYDSKPLGDCIKLSKEQNIINDTEETRLKLMVKQRDGYIHSSKSRIFAKNKFPVQLVKIENKRIKVVETKEMKIGDLMFAHGFAQKSLSDREAKRLFLEIEDFIYRICGRFMKNYKKEGVS